MKTTFYITILLLTCLSLQTCGNDCEADCTDIKEAPKEFLDYWYFPKGSWWVYKLVDSTQEVYDTVNLAGSAEYFSEVEIGCFDNSYEPCIKRYEAYFEHSNKDYYPTATGKLGGEAHYCQFNPQNGRWYLIHHASTLKLHSYGTFVLYPFDTLDTYSNGAHLCALNEPFEYEGQEYNSFKVCKPLDPGKSALDFHKLTFAQGIGLVSITYDNEETWNLTDYNVNP